jgi:hypothetical protein
VQAGAAVDEVQTLSTSYAALKEVQTVELVAGSNLGAPLARSLLVSR